MCASEMKTTTNLIRTLLVGLENFIWKADNCTEIKLEFVYVLKHSSSFAARVAYRLKVWSMS